MKDFIPYKEALELKHLGFDELCLDVYNKYGKLWGMRFDNQSTVKDACSAPLFSQAFRFFRQKYNIVFCVNMVACDNFYFVIHLKLGIIDNPDDLFISHHMKTNEEAELACLKKLIELVS